MKILKLTQNQKLPAIRVASDQFKCRSCGFVEYLRSLNNTAKCPQCGGTMDRL